jgi:hypothetical protein
MQFSGGSNNCVAFNNRSWNNGDHGYDHLASSAVSHTNDVAYGNFKDGFSFEGISPGGSVFNSIAVNNGITSDEFDLWVDLESSVGFVSDRNIFWNSTLQDPIKFGATRYALLSDYQVASGQDAHSFQADPRFANAAASDFNLRVGSPAIDAGDAGVPNWPATDAAGGARFDHLGTVDTGAGPVTFSDIGALELAAGGLLPWHDEADAGQHGDVHRRRLRPGRRPDHVARHGAEEDAAQQRRDLHRERDQYGRHVHLADGDGHRQLPGGVRRIERAGRNGQRQHPDQGHGPPCCGGGD